MSAIILKFPRRGPFHVDVVPEADGDGWLVIARSHGWLFGDRDIALEIAAGFGVTVMSS
jgi:hypothetical protein